MGTARWSCSNLCAVFLLAQAGHSSVEMRKPLSVCLAELLREHAIVVLYEPAVNNLLHYEFQ